MDKMNALVSGFVNHCLKRGITKQAGIEELWDSAKRTLNQLSPSEMAALTGAASGLGGYGLASYMDAEDPLMWGLGTGLAGAGAGAFGKSYYDALTQRLPSIRPRETEVEKSVSPQKQEYAKDPTGGLTRLISNPEDEQNYALKIDPEKHRAVSRFRAGTTYLGGRLTPEDMALAIPPPGEGLDDEPLKPVPLPSDDRDLINQDDLRKTTERGLNLRDRDPENWTPPPSKKSHPGHTRDKEYFEREQKLVEESRGLFNKQMPPSERTLKGARKFPVGFEFKEDYYDKPHILQHELFTGQRGKARLGNLLERLFNW